MQHFQISLDAKFNLKETILIVLAKFAQVLFIVNSSFQNFSVTMKLTY